MRDICVVRNNPSVAPRQLTLHKGAKYVDLTFSCHFHTCIRTKINASPKTGRANRPACQSVKEHVQQGADKRAAGELEGARPASNTINRRPKVLIHQRLLEQSSILIISKCSADEACQKKSSQDFFDKLKQAGRIALPVQHFIHTFQPLSANHHSRYRPKTRRFLTRCSRCCEPYRRRRS